MAVKLPENVNSPRCAAYDTWFKLLHARINKFAPMLEFKYKDSKGIESPASESQHARIVWQYYFIDHSSASK